MVEEKKDIMLTQDGCGYCDEAEELFKDKIEDGRMEVISVDTPYGQHLAEKYDIDQTPTVITKDNDKTRKCYIDFDKKILECDDGSEKALD